MQVERESPFGGKYSGGLLSNTQVTNPRDRNNFAKARLMPDIMLDRLVEYEMVSLRGFRSRTGLWPISLLVG